MEAKVQLYDSENNRIGETFTRRARQLVNQQRAIWADESRTSIRFTPDMEEDWEKEEALIEEPPAARSKLYLLAERRLQERKKFIYHSIFVLPGLFFIIILFGEEMGAVELAYLLSGGWLTAYGMHFHSFVKKHLSGFRTISQKERRERKLADEVDRLKRMGYDE